MNIYFWNRIKELKTASQTGPTEVAIQQSGFSVLPGRLFYSPMLIPCAADN